MLKTPRMRLLEYERGRPIEEIIEHCAAQDWTHEEIARDLGIAPKQLYDWCRRLGLRLVPCNRVERIETLTGAGR